MTARKIRTNKHLLRVAYLAGAVVVVLLALELTNTTHIFHKAKVPPVIPTHSNTTASTDNQSSAQAATPNQAGANAQPSASSPSTADTNHTLITPFGNFVSNHFPGQNNSPSTETSVCNSTPGATCYIKFTNAATGQTTQLPSQTLQANGSTSWFWDVSKDAHLTSGEWQVTAVANLGSQTKSASDSLRLTIQ